MTESEAFRFGYNQALLGKVVLYMGEHVRPFQSGCQIGHEVRVKTLANTLLEADNYSLTVQKDGLIRVIKALRAELKTAQAEVQRLTELTKPLMGASLPEAATAG